jgi:hypothetical protein
MDSNPFSTRFIRPGALDYFALESVSTKSLVAKLQENGWQGAIVGPHGAGKTTLLTALAAELVQHGRHVVHAALHQGEHSLPKSLDDWRAWNEQTQVIVDGYEQLSWWAKSKLAWRVRDRRAGLLVTSHEGTALPELIRMAPSIDVAREVVRRLVGNSTLITDDDVTTQFRATDGNIREMLFRLYCLPGSALLAGSSLPYKSFTPFASPLRPAPACRFLHYRWCDLLPASKTAARPR